VRLTGQQVGDDLVLVRFGDDHRTHRGTEPVDQVGDQDITFHDQRRGEREVVGDDCTQAGGESFGDGQRVVDDLSGVEAVGSGMGIPVVQGRVAGWGRERLERGDEVVGFGQRHAHMLRQRVRNG